MSEEARILENAPYSSLVRPDPADPSFLASIGRLVEIASRTKPDIVGRLICWQNWRHRLVGQSLGVMIKYRGYEHDLLRSLASPTGWNALAATAALAVAVRRRQGKLAERDFSACGPTPWSGDVWRGIDAAIRYVDSGEIVRLESTGGPDFEPHVIYHEWLWNTDHKHILELSRKSSDETWKGKERQCPSCSARFTSVQNLGQCRSCHAIFYASDPTFSRRRAG